MEKCTICEENSNKKVKNIKIIIAFENPNAYGYPEVCNWEEQYSTKQCPACKRKVIE